MNHYQKINNEYSNILNRPRVNELLEKATTNPLVLVCASAGYGKTRAVFDFINKQKTSAIWMQCSERDNVGSRFWESYVKAVAEVNELASDQMREFGFPDTEDKLHQFFEIIFSGISNQGYIYVFDDYHLLKDPTVLQFTERVIFEMQKSKTVILICRSITHTKIMGLRVKGNIPIIDENDLSFTENELIQYTHQQELSLDRNNIREVFQDTKGWALSVNLVVRSLQNSPGYSGYIRTGMRASIFDLFESEVWRQLSENLKRFLICLSLVDHLSVELINILSESNEHLISELDQQNAYIRFDKSKGAYLIHHLFLDFLRTKQGILTDDEIYKTYKAAADWCKSNDYQIDALGYYEKIGDYDAIISVLFATGLYIPTDFASHIISIFEQAPSDTFEKVSFFAILHLYSINCLGRWNDFFVLADNYEKLFLKQPKDSDFRNHNLAALYLLLGIVRLQISTIDNRYDFVDYFAKVEECLIHSPIHFGNIINPPIGAWFSMAGSDKKGAPHKYIDAVNCLIQPINRCLDGIFMGVDDLCQGELLFYQGDIKEAELYIIRGLENARQYSRFETTHRALFYLMRIAVLQGKLKKAEEMIGEMEAMLNEKDYNVRFITYDIAYGWYQYILRQPKLFPNWLKEKFAPYGLAFCIVNFGNQIKARYHYLTKNYQPLLMYINEMKQRESILYGRIEMLAMEACVYYQMKDTMAALTALEQAYKAANPNNILMPFIELGKDMRTLVAAALREDSCGIPKSWLEDIKRRASYYAKQQSLLVSDTISAKGINYKILSSRENDILYDLYHGLSRAEIASKQNLSINRVSSAINIIYNKLGANSVADVIRIVVERNLI